MKKPQYSIRTTWAFILFPIIPFISTIILLLLKEWFPALFCFIIFLIIFILVFTGRRLIFSKMLIDEEGIKIYYKNNVIKNINWLDINDCRIQSNQLIVTKYSGLLNNQKTILTNQKKLIWINLDKKPFAQELHKHLNKIKVPIKGLENVPNNLKDYFKDYLQKK